MPTVSEKNLRAALGNIVHFGDTDVLRFPLERHWFAVDEDSVVLLLQRIDSDFDEYVGTYPVTFVKSLTGVGYNVFRAVTQIDPIWSLPPIRSKRRGARATGGCRASARIRR